MAGNFPIRFFLGVALSEFSSYGNVVTTKRIHHLDSNETHGEKARWELLKNATYCFEHILETSSYKTAIVWPLISHLINHPSKTRHARHCKTN